VSYKIKEVLFLKKVLLTSLREITGSTVYITKYRLQRSFKLRINGSRFTEKEYWGYIQQLKKAFSAFSKPSKCNITRKMPAVVFVTHLYSVLIIFALRMCITAWLESSLSGRQIKNPDSASTWHVKDAVRDGWPHSKQWPWHSGICRAFRSSAFPQKACGARLSKAQYKTAIVAK